MPSWGRGFDRSPFRAWCSSLCNQLDVSATTPASSTFLAGQISSLKHQIQQSTPAMSGYVRACAHHTCTSKMQLVAYGAEVAASIAPPTGNFHVVHEHSRIRGPTTGFCGELDAQTLVSNQHHC